MRLNWLQLLSNASQMLQQTVATKIVGKPRLTHNKVLVIPNKLNVKVKIVMGSNNGFKRGWQQLT
jgi:hypothetical protein